MVKMVRVITQETYDEVVKENIEEFDMSAEEAIKEAVAQFEAQGVDLSNIIKDLKLGPGENHLVTTTIMKLKDISRVEDYNIEELIKELDVLKAECEKDIAHRVRAGKEGAYKLLIDLLALKDNEFSFLANPQLSEKECKVIVSVLITLKALMDAQPDLLDQRGVNLIKYILDNTDNDKILLATLKWTSICCLKHEMNRQKLFGKNIRHNLKCLLKASTDKEVLSETLQVIRKLTLDDDIRVEFGKAHDHAKEMGVEMLVPLTNLLQDYTQPPLVCELMVTMASLLVRHDLCKMVADCGVDILFTIMADNFDNGRVIQQANKLIIALSGNDDVKRALVKSCIVPVSVTTLTRHSNDPVTTAWCLKSIAALTLREPEHSKQYLDNDAAEAIIACMKIHPDVADVQKNACRAIRNLTVRCREHNARFHELGVKQLLDLAYEKYHEEFGFDIRSALRDLDCDVKLDEQWTGKGMELDR